MKRGGLALFLALIVEKVLDTLGQSGQNRVIKEHVKTGKQQRTHDNRN
jgi:hypothetical protein